MRHLDKPRDDPTDVFRLCISKVEDSTLRTALESITPEIRAAAEEFNAAAQAVALHTVKSQDAVGGKVTAKEMGDVYTQRMVRKKAAGRIVYDRLLTSPPYGRCPLCGERTVSSLDHHLPKAKYPALAVVPTNLIPACAECNKVKLDAAPSSPEEQTLHPYYDNVDSIRWLEAFLNEVRPRYLSFFVGSPSGMDALTRERLVHHFRVFRLAELYASHAAEELANIEQHIGSLLATGGSGQVRAHLEECANSREAVRVNSWQSATYRALADSEWYCAGSP
jgi:hypothetical protein